MFDLFDADCSGYLSKDELVVLLQSIGYYPSDEWVTETMLNFDTDGNDEIDYIEFLDMCQFLEMQNVTQPASAVRDALR